MGVLNDFCPLAGNLFSGSLTEISSLRYLCQIPLSDPLKSATSSKLTNEVRRQADRNDSVSIVSLEKWAKMPLLLLLILMAIEFY